MCVVGTGVPDYPAVRRALDDIGYAGCITIETQRDPRNVAHDPARCRGEPRASRVFPASAGFA